MKVKTKHVVSHTPKSPRGVGDFYGTGVPQKLGKIKEGMGLNPTPKSKIKKPPKSLA